MEKEIERDLIMIGAEQIFEDADEDWSGEFEFDEFVKAFRSNQHFLRRVAIACNVPVRSIIGLSSEDIEELFAQFDVDRSGTVSFEESIKGLAKIRLFQEKCKALEEAEAGMMDEMEAAEAFVDAANAFDDATGGGDTELSFEDFYKA